MKILFLVPIPPPVHGSSLMNQYLINLISKDPEFIVRIIDWSYAKNVKDIGSISLKKVIVYFLNLIRLLFCLFSFRPNLVYFTPASSGSAFFRDAISAVIIRTFRKRLILHLHGKGYSKKKFRSFSRRLAISAFRGSEIVCLSKNLAHEYCNYPYFSLNIIPNGIPIGARPSVKKAGNAPAKILFLSNLCESKGVLILLEAVAKILSSFSCFRVDLVGGEFDLTFDSLNARIREMKLEKVVFLHGPKFGLEKDAFLASTDIFVFPTFYENECFPLVILEAMKYSLPVISTFEGGIPEIVDEGVTGFLVPQKDSSALAEKILYLLQNMDLARQMGIAGNAKFAAEFSLDRFFSRIKAAFLQDSAMVPFIEAAPTCTMR